ncbi:hypothetical protein DJFAAGMI_01281 [Comamonas sp. PE63]|uniref:Uncharacterized protein n=1 Tax=Comamonas brasiliensis TaxID=1812482 RepID=A0ABS5LQB5_9BURK|nr:hypothetical protein [Comamonas sp. PE63]MBS3018549.1 hypothetical protein [Comamonas sp. PE63]
MSSKRTFIGIFLTLLYLLVSCIFAITSWPSGGLSLNEFGDMLGGAFGPIAFLWLVLGYLQQGEELKANGAALEAQARELNKSVEEQRAQAEAIKKQVEQDRAYYEFLRLSAEKQQRELIQSQQPILTIDTKNSSISGSVLETTIILRNAGATCTFISAKIHTSIDIKTIEYNNIYLETGKSIPILHLTFNNSEMTGTISIFYLDAMQRQGRINLRIARTGILSIKTVGDDIDIAASSWGDALSHQLRSEPSNKL